MRRIRSITTLAIAASLALVAVPAAAWADATAAAADQLAVTKTDATLRSQPTTASTPLEWLPRNQRVLVTCWTAGEPTFGTDTYGSMWLSVVSDSSGESGYVHSYLVTPVNVPHC